MTEKKKLKKWQINRAIKLAKAAEKIAKACESKTKYPILTCGQFAGGECQVYPNGDQDEASDALEKKYEGKPKYRCILGMLLWALPAKARREAAGGCSAEDFFLAAFGLGIGEINSLVDLGENCIDKNDNEYKSFKDRARAVAKPVKKLAKALRAFAEKGVYEGETDDSDVGPVILLG